MAQNDTLFVPDLARAMGISEKALRRRIEDGRRTIPRPRRGLFDGRQRLYWRRQDVRMWAGLIGRRVSI